MSPASDETGLGAQRGPPKTPTKLTRKPAAASVAKNPDTDKHNQPDTPSKTQNSWSARKTPAKLTTPAKSQEAKPAQSRRADNDDHAVGSDTDHKIQLKDEQDSLEQSELPEASSFDDDKPNAEGGLTAVEAEPIPDSDDEAGEIKPNGVQPASNDLDNASIGAKEDQTEADEYAEEDQEAKVAVSEAGSDETPAKKRNSHELLDGAKSLANKASSMASKSGRNTSKSKVDLPEETDQPVKKEGHSHGDSRVSQAPDSRDTDGPAPDEDVDDKIDADSPQHAVKHGRHDSVKDPQLGEGDQDAQVPLKEDISAEDNPLSDKQNDNAPHAADDAKDNADAAGGLQSDDLPLDFSVLKGLEVQPDGLVLDRDGNAIGKLVEGDAEDLGGYPIGDDAEILDEDGDLVGRIELLPEEITRQLYDAREQGVELSEKANEYLAQISQSGEGGNSSALVQEEAADLHDKTQEEDDPAEEATTDLRDTAEDAVAGADEAGEELEDELPGIEALQGKEINELGVVDEQGDLLGLIEDEDLKKKIESGEIDANDLQVNEQGMVVDADGNVLSGTKLADGAAEKLTGTAATYDIRILEGRRVNKKSKVLDDEGEEIGHLVEGDAKACAGQKIGHDGTVTDKSGKKIGQVRVTEGSAAQDATEALLKELDGGSNLPGLEILDGLRVNKKGKILNEDGDPIGELVEGEASECAGLKCNAKGEVLSKSGSVIGRVQTLPATAEEADHLEEPGSRAEQGLEGGEEEQAQEAQVSSSDVDNDDLPPLSILEGLKVNKAGNLVNAQGDIVGELIEGDAKKLSRSQTRCDAEGKFWDKGRVIGHARTVNQSTDEEGIFAGLEGLRVVDGGFIEDDNAHRVGKLVEGDAKKLLGRAVDDDGDILDKKGSVVGRAERWEEDEVAVEDLSFIHGKKVNKAGFVIGDEGVPVARLVEGSVKAVAGRRVDREGKIWSDSGKIIGRVELVPEDDRDSSPDGPFAGLDGLHVIADGEVADQAGNTVGRVVEGDAKRLVGRSVDADGEIVDKYGNSVGRAERWEAEEKERRKSPMAGLRVNREGEVRSQDGDLIGRLTEGALSRCVGHEIDDNDNVVDQDGNKLGEVTLLENIVEDEYEGPSEEELEEAKKRDEERDIADKMGNICQQTLDRMQPICKQISEHMEKADRTPKDELDEEELVNNVRPLIEEGGRILQECNGSLRGLDPDGHIAAQAKGRAGTKEATPEEYRLAETLKELTTTVVTTIDNAKKKLNDMPHAKKKLNPLWALLTQPLFQILAAVGLLLAGVLGLVGQLLNGLGLGGLVNGLLGGLGIDKLLESFGLGGKKQKKGNPIKSLPVIGNLVGGK